MHHKERRPLIAEIPNRLTAPEAFESFEDIPLSFFLDSSMKSSRLGRYSFVGSDPFLVLRSYGDEIFIWDGSQQVIQKGSPFNVLEELLDTYTLDPYPSPIPFTGGAVGYFSYDLSHFIEHIPSTTIDDLRLPECYFAFYDWIVAFDHLTRKTYAISTGFPELDEGKRRIRARERLEEVKRRLSTTHSPLTSFGFSQEDDRIQDAIRSNFTPVEYLRAVECVREYITAGDVFQVNLSQRFETDLHTSPYELYKHLRQINPAPFAAYLNFGDVSLLSASPERFLRVEGDMVETRPIKGTRPRGMSTAEDEALATELLHSAKDRAENIMIVDLERNDLGRVCRFGTVKVKELTTLEKYPTVFHLTSSVVGRLCEGKTRIDLLKACFPGGSITGAPKIRAMEIIDELEPTRRSVYTGSIGYLSFSSDMDVNIAIRTILIKDKNAYFQVGGGIVYDSNPEIEYQETLDKAKALFEALRESPKLAAIA